MVVARLPNGNRENILLEGLTQIKHCGKADDPLLAIQMISENWHSAPDQDIARCGEETRRSNIFAPDASRDFIRGRLIDQRVPQLVSNLESQRFPRAPGEGIRIGQNATTGFDEYRFAR